MLKKITYSFSLALSLLLCGCDRGGSAESMVSIKSDKAGFELTGMDGRKITFEAKDGQFKSKELEGKATLLVFFATWCPPCVAEVPHLVEIQNKFGDKAEVIAVLAEENKPMDELRSFADKHSINYFVANSPVNSNLVEFFGVRALPTMYLFDANGTKSAYYPGATPAERIEIDIKKALGE